jgi:CubicO group peptidase (beta-lactamase class C family)
LRGYYGSSVFPTLQSVHFSEGSLMRIRAFLLLLAYASLATAQSSGRGSPQVDTVDRVKQIFADYNHMDTPGCSVGVSLAGNEVLRGAWGMADLEHQVVLTPDTVFEAGSVSKQFTAAAVLLLAEQGKLSLTDPVSKYFPELPAYGKPVTIEQLLHHTSGLRDWGAVVAVAGWQRTTREYSNAWVLDIASGRKPSTTSQAMSGHTPTRVTTCLRCWCSVCPANPSPSLRTRIFSCRLA